MEPMVVCALGIAVYCGYLTMKDIFTDLQREGILVKVRVREKKKEIPSLGILVYGRRLSRVGGLIAADFGLAGCKSFAGSVSGNSWAADLTGGYFGYHNKGRCSRG